MLLRKARICTLIPSGTMHPPKHRPLARVSDQKLTKPFFEAPAGITRSTLNRTVFDSGLQ
jgi:hypothetical protein